MSEDKIKKNKASDELDLGALFSKIQKGINSLLTFLKMSFLRGYMLVKVNLVWIIGLIVLGFIVGKSAEVLIGYKYELNVIVTPNLDSKSYLNQVVKDIQAHIESKDTAFFKSKGMDIDEMDGFEIEVVPIKGSNPDEYEQELEFLGFLKDTENPEILQNLLNGIIQDQTTPDQTIIFRFKDVSTGEKYAKKLINYINSNPYYKKLDQVFVKNAKIRVKLNEDLMDQLDVLIRNYSKMLASQKDASTGSFVLENQEPLNIPALFNLKNEIIRDSELKRIELEKREGAITIISFGKPRIVEMEPLLKYTILLPLIFLGILILIAIIKQVNKKAEQYFLQ